MSQGQIATHVPLTSAPEGALLGSKVVQIPASSTLAEIREVYDRNGIVCLKDAIDTETIEKVNDFLDPLLDREAMGRRAQRPAGRNVLGEMIGVAQRPEGKRELELSTKTRRGDVLAMAPDLLEPFVAHPKILELVENVLGKYSETILLHQTSAIEIHPGERPQDFHRDSGTLWRAPGIRFPQGMVAQAVLKNFTAEAGATEVLFASHRWPEAVYYDPEKEGGWSKYMSPVRDPEPEEITAVEVAAGSIFIWDGDLFHRGGANTSVDSVRRSISAAYCLGWLRGEINQQLMWPPEVAKKFSRRLQHLIGYRLENHVIGGLEMGQDPIYLLEDD